MHISPQQTKIGWIGTGIMGASMCGHLLRAGFQTTVFSRTRSKAEPLLAAGATWADSPRLVAESSDVIFAIVGLPADVRSVFLGTDGILAGCKPANIVVDMTTSEPALATEIAAAAQQRDVQAIDAPVSGGDIGAKKGTLSIMIGGDADAAASLQPCWQLMGRTFVHQGGPGAGQHTKMVNQILVASSMIGVCESLLYAHGAGLNLDSVLQSVSGGAAGSWALSNLAPRIINNDFAPGFYVDHFVKDLGIAVAESKTMGLNLPGLTMAETMYQNLQAAGNGECGTQALQKTIAQMSRVDWEDRT
jgi:3-hydroxyisobutyrate dehydrogenase